MALAVPAVSRADPAAELAAAEERVSAASAQADAADKTVGQARATLGPIEKQADLADTAAEDAITAAKRVRDELVAERVGAARQIKSAETDYKKKKGDHEASIDGGAALVILVAIVVLAALVVYKTRQRWPLSKRVTQLLGGFLVLLLVSGLVALASPAPKAPSFSPETLKLAAFAKGDPADPPTADLLNAEADAKPLVAKARPLDKARDAAERRLSAAESKAGDARRNLNHAKHDADKARNAVEREERRAREEERFKEEATTIDYKQLNKNADAYKGEKVVYRGQIFQIQESEGETIILLAVTDEGYGFWTDNIWVDYAGTVSAAEESIITVYGTITGTKSYETQIGGETYVPAMRAKYIVEE